MRRKRINWKLIVIVLIVLFAGYVTWPTAPDISIKSYHKELKIHEGLDLAGGTHLVYEADTKNLAPKDKAEAMVSLKNVIERRINSLGVSEPVIQTGKIGDKDTVVVELAGVDNVNNAKSLIGQTAKLRFIAELMADPDGNPFPTDAATLVGGEHLKKATVIFDDSTGLPQVSLKFNNEGAKKFADATRVNVGKPIYILLDRQIISAPTVQGEINGGEAVITGQFIIPEAKELATLINGGALPVSIKVIEERTIGATLGDASIKASLVAGLVGMILVGIFMVVQYRFKGFVAIVALVIYTLIMISLFKLVPITLTLAGIAGFILSIGMAVDANILIFERMKEELAVGRNTASALEAGFARAWNSIRDSNVSSIITAVILFEFGSGLIRGFAVTLIIGILVSMFTAITITRTLLNFNLKYIR